MVVELNLADFAGDLAMEKIILPLFNACEVTVWAQIGKKLLISTLD